jgi:hypothetical protein
MLSHLMGATNRADMRRLVTLEAELTRTREELDESRVAMRAGFSLRDRQINQLQSTLVSSHASRRATSASPEETSSLRSAAAKLQQRLGAAEVRVDKLSRLLSEARSERDSFEKMLLAQQELAHELQADILDLEERLDAPDDHKADRLALVGMTILYVGGRTSSIPRLRRFIERRNGRLVHHDGGQAQNVSLLAGLIGSADCVVFPVEFVSHQAMQILKRRCHDIGKPFVALPSTGTASLLRALEGIVASASS